MVKQTTKGKDHIEGVNMTELEQLMKQKREIEMKIRDIESGEKSITVGNARWECKIYPSKKREWRVAVNNPRVINKKKVAWFYPVVKECDKETALNAYDDLIEDLIELRKRIREE